MLCEALKAGMEEPDAFLKALVCSNQQMGKLARPPVNLEQEACSRAWLGLDMKA